MMNEINSTVPTAVATDEQKTVGVILLQSEINTLKRVTHTTRDATAVATFVRTHLDAQDAEAAR